MVDVPRHVAGAIADELPDHSRRAGHMGQARWQDLAQQADPIGRLPRPAHQGKRSDPRGDQDRQVRRHRPDARGHEGRSLEGGARFRQ